MNWIINSTKKLTCHTILTELFKPIYDEIDNYNWIISDVEFNGSLDFYSLPVNYDDEYFILTPEQFKAIVDTDIQTIWAVILDVPLKEAITINIKDIPYADGNPQVFEDGHIQFPDAVIEIVCFDSGYTIVKFKDVALSAKFKEHFDEAITLEKFRKKYMRERWRGY